MMSTTTTMRITSTNKQITITTGIIHSGWKRQRFVCQLYITMNGRKCCDRLLSYHLLLLHWRLHSSFQRETTFSSAYSQVLDAANYLMSTVIAGDAIQVVRGHRRYASYKINCCESTTVTVYPDLLVTDELYTYTGILLITPSLIEYTPPDCRISGRSAVRLF